MCPEKSVCDVTLDLQPLVKYCPKKNGHVSNKNFIKKKYYQKIKRGVSGHTKKTHFLQFFSF